jgi:hypothetical protein
MRAPAPGRDRPPAGHGSTTAAKGAAASEIQPLLALRTFSRSSWMGKSLRLLKLFGPIPNRFTKLRLDRLAHRGNVMLALKDSGGHRETEFNSTS